MYVIIYICSKSFHLFIFKFFPKHNNFRYRGSLQRSIISGQFLKTCAYQYSIINIDIEFYREQDFDGFLVPKLQESKKEIIVQKSCEFTDFIAL